jgi:hypothetical protein
MTSLRHLPENDAARAIINREQSHKMRSKDHSSPLIDHSETPVLAHKRLVINNI